MSCNTDGADCHSAEQGDEADEARGGRAPGVGRARFRETEVQHFRVSGQMAIEILAGAVWASHPKSLRASCDREAVSAPM